MTEHAPVHETVQSNDAPQLNAAGEDVGLTVDRAHSTALADAKRYRKRAQNAEKQLEELKVTLAEREQKLSEIEKSLAQSRREQQIDRALTQAGAMDVDVARQLVVAAMDQTPNADAQSAVEELKRAKPYLFRQINTALGSGAMSAAIDESTSTRSLSIQRAAFSALETGRRSDLLRYLRLRRRAS